MNIYVVDDDTLTLEKLSRTLAGWGHAVHSFSSSLNALAAYAESDSVDLVLTDWVMPDTDGIALSQAIRQIAKERRVFLVMLTSRSDTHEKVKALEAGVDAFLTKPVDEAELKASLLVAERQVDMQNELGAKVQQLTLARHQAELAAQSKQAFLAQMSHELRTPMQAVLTAFETLKSTQLGLEQSELLSLAEGSAKGLLRILNDILDFSKLESKMMTFEFGDFSLSRVVYESLAPLRLRAIESGLDFQCILLSEQDRVTGDAGRLAQILVNLVGNALKFTEKGSVLITISRSTETPDQWVFIIKDTGLGIPPEALEQVFEPFVQSQQGEQRPNRGTGLGLPLCRSMAQGMKGDLTLQSQVGVGTIVTLTLPLPPATPASDPRWQNFSHLSFQISGSHPEAERILLAKGLAKTDANPDLLIGSDPSDLPKCNHFIWIADSPAETLNSRRGIQVDAILHPPIVGHSLLRGLIAAVETQESPTSQAVVEGRVLLVEDNPINSKVMASALRKHGVLVETAEDGKQAVEKRLASEFDIIFMDMQMPVLDGIQATQAIRKWEEQNRHLPCHIIGLTAHTLEEAEAQFMQAGANSVMTKPVPIGNLLQAISAYKEQTFGT